MTKRVCTRAVFLAPSACAINGVMAVENPIPNDMATKTKLLPKDTAATRLLAAQPLYYRLTEQWYALAALRSLGQLALNYKETLWCRRIVGSTKTVIK